MIKDVFKLKKSGWHAKYMKWIWGYTPQDFPNMCPYFWLTVLNVVGAPIIVSMKLVLYIGRYIILAGEQMQSGIDKACDSKLMKWVDSKLDTIWTDEYTHDYIASKMYSYNDYDGENRTFSASFSSKSSDKKYRKLFDKMSNEDKAKMYDTYKARMQEIRNLAEERRQKSFKQTAKKRETKAQRIGKATVLIKKAFNIIKWPIGAGILYLVYLFVAFMASLDYTGFGAGVWWITLSVVACLSIVGIFQGIVTFARWFACMAKDACVSCDIRRAKIVKFFKIFSFFKYLGYPFIYTWKGVKWFTMGLKTGLVVSWELLMALKADNCPSIEWED
jgi:hypothetical protein